MRAVHKMGVQRHKIKVLNSCTLNYLRTHSHIERSYVSIEFEIKPVLPTT